MRTTLFSCLGLCADACAARNQPGLRAATHEDVPGAVTASLEWLCMPSVPMRALAMQPYSVDTVEI